MGIYADAVTGWQKMREIERENQIIEKKFFPRRKYFVYVLCISEKKRATVNEYSGPFPVR